MQSDSSTPRLCRHPRHRSVPCSVADCLSNACARGFCVKHYGRWLAHGDPLYTMYDLDKTPEERFWAKVDKSGGPDACWPFIAAGRALTTDRYGGYSYGRFARGFPVHGAHVIAWSLTNGRWPKAGEVVRHHCDNPPCCNPKHLAIGVQKDNIADAFAHGNGWAADKSSSAKLTWELVYEIRRLRSQERLSWTALSQRFGLSRSATRAAAISHTWKPTH